LLLCFQFEEIAASTKNAMQRLLTLAVMIIIFLGYTDKRISNYLWKGLNRNYDFVNIVVGKPDMPLNA
jgi:hypothetical protein